jgi:hypothetical protein
MFGGRKKRVEKLSARAKTNLEDGESIRELVQTQTGQSAAANASAVATSAFIVSGRITASSATATGALTVAGDRQAAKRLGNIFSRNHLLAPSADQ